MYQVNFGTEAVAAGGCVLRCHCYLEVGEWEGVLSEMVSRSVGVAVGVGSRSTLGWYLWGSGVKTMASLRPLSLRCIFYKGAVAGLGFTRCCLSV